MKKSIKVIVSIVVLTVSVCGFLTYWFFHGITTKVPSIQAVEEYGAVDFFPSDYKSFDNVSFTRTNKLMLIFRSDAITMKIQDSEKFESLKKDIAEKYGEKDFLGNEPFEYKSAVFRTVCIGEYGYPKQWGVIGISETKKEIYYLWFYDSDLDVIEDFKEFVVENFKI